MPSKQTKRERKELAKKQRLEEMRRAARRRRLRRVQTIATTALVIGGITGAVLWNNARSRAAQERADRQINQLASAAGCDQIQHPADIGHEHINPPQRAEYNSNPPTSGQHYNIGPATPPGGPAFTGVHPAPIQDEAQVHNLEHGHIGIQYKPDGISPAVRTALEEFTRANADWTFMAPRTLPGFDDKLAFTAWGQLVSCGDTLKDDAATVKALAQAFYDRFKDKSPYESVAGTPRR